MGEATAAATITTQETRRARQGRSENRKRHAARWFQKAAKVPAAQSMPLISASQSPALRGSAVPPRSPG